MIKILLAISYFLLMLLNINSIFAKSNNISQNNYFFTQKHNCDLRLSPINKTFFFLSKQINIELKAKGYNVRPFLDRSRILPEEEYLKISVKRTDGFWKKCIITIILKKSKSNYPQKSDPLLLKKTVTRMYPRVTPTGNERCIRAIKDIMVNLKYCKKF